MSAMWSASSMTVISTADRSASFCSIRSSSRPGQATSTSTPRCSALACGFWPTPPNTTVDVRPDAFSSILSDSCNWVANSRVGARIRERGRLGCLRVSDSRSRATSGSRKAKVLPDPVRPRPSTSRPASESGSVAAWMGVGVVMPRSRRAAARWVGTPRRAKSEDKMGTYRE